MVRKASSGDFATLFISLTEGERLALVDHPNELKRFSQRLIMRSARSAFFVPLLDDEVTKELTIILTSWRKLARYLSYFGPIVWKVRAGFTLLKHASRAGPCYQDFKYLVNGRAPRDEPTADSYVFWIPRLVYESRNKSPEEQLLILSELRQKFYLPENHLTSLGSVALIAGLILAHLKFFGDRVPLGREWVCTDTPNHNGGRFSLGDFDGELYCEDLEMPKAKNLGCFPLGVEARG